MTVRELAEETLESVIIVSHIVPYVPTVLEGARQVMHTSPDLRMMVTIGLLEIIRLSAAQQLYRANVLNADETLWLWIGTSLALGMWFQHRHQKSTV